MARSWFQYNLTDPTERTVASNYIAVAGFPNCPTIPVNICAVYATVSATQPVLTQRLLNYINAAGMTPFAPQPSPGLPAVKKYVYTRGE